MAHIELHNKFIETLEEQSPKRAALVARIADILKIERDSVNRRLTRKVQFSIREMGILASEMGISIDGLIYNDTAACSELLTMENPGLQISSKEKIISDMKQYAQTLQEVVEQPYSEYGALISSLPMEIYVHYPSLLKFNCFKWEHYMQNMSKSFNEFEISDKTSKFANNIKRNFNDMSYKFYIWDYSVIWAIICDINYFKTMDLIEQEDVEKIKTELNEMLYSLESSLITYKNSGETKKTEHYVSNVDMEISASYLWSEEYFHSFIFTFFMRSSTFSDKNKCIKIRDWINSMKRVSTLISGSGEPARIKFFKQQHLYINSL